MLLPNTPIIQEINSSFLNQKKVQVFVKREDKIHPTISGNKWRKLYYNMEQVKRIGQDTILTFGGAFSNHIAATAAAGKEHGVKTIGVIRGEEHNPLNPTLAYAKACGMEFLYLDRESYKDKDSFDMKESLREEFGSFYLIPEGGSNFYGLNGCMEIIGKEDHAYDYVVCPAGTGCTAAGIALSLKANQKLLVFPALKGGDFLIEEIEKFIHSIAGDQELTQSIMDRVFVITDYHFGGYAKTQPSLLAFLRDFNQEHGIPWDPIYNGKACYGLWDLIQKDYFPPHSKIVAIHTGGLQGIKGIEEKIGESIY